MYTVHIYRVEWGLEHSVTRTLSFDLWHRFHLHPSNVSSSSYLCTARSCINYNSGELIGNRSCLAHSGPRGSDVFWQKLKRCSYNLRRIYQHFGIFVSGYNHWLFLFMPVFNIDENMLLQRLMEVSCSSFCLKIIIPIRIDQLFCVCLWKKK